MKCCPRCLQRSHQNGVFGCPKYEVGQDNSNYNPIECQDITLSILLAAQRTVDVERMAEHGDPVENWEAIAEAASAIIGKNLTVDDCLIIMKVVKLVRSAANPQYYDNYLDDVGYTLIRLRANKINGGQDAANMDRPGTVGQEQG